MKDESEELIQRLINTNKVLMKNNEDLKLEIKEKSKKKEVMGDVYDVYSKASGVHSNVTDMTEDYTLTRYESDVYLQKFPAFIREQRKILRIIESYLIIPMEELKEFYNNENKAKEVHSKLQTEYKKIKQLLQGEVDECVIMGRSPKGEVIKSFLEHGLERSNRERIENEINSPTIKDELTKRG